MGWRGATGHKSQTQKSWQDCNNIYRRNKFEHLFSQFKHLRPLWVMGRMGMLTIANQPRAKAVIFSVGKDIFVFEDTYLHCGTFFPHILVSHICEIKWEKITKKINKRKPPRGVLRRINQHSPWEENLVVSVLSLGEGGVSSYQLFARCRYVAVARCCCIALPSWRGLSWLRYFLGAFRLHLASYLGLRGFGEVGDEAYYH